MIFVNFIYIITGIIWIYFIVGSAYVLWVDARQYAPSTEMYVVLAILSSLTLALMLEGYSL